MGPGDPAPAAKGATGSREVVPLRRVGAVLVGYPETETVELVTVRASAQPAAVSLVLWERVESDGSIMLRLSVPDALQRSLIGATLFLPARPGATWAAIASDGEWMQLSAVEIPRDDSRELRAFPTGDLGVFLLRRGDVGAAGSLPAPDPAAFGADVRVARAGWHIVWPSVLLAVMVLLSRRQHKRTAAR
jgi:hypothetical protein